MLAIALRKIGVSAKKSPSREVELTRYWDPHLARRAVKLKPGEHCVSTTDEMLVSVVGSTCALCLREPDEGLVAMLNFSLPTQGLSTLDEKGREQALRYGKSQLDTLFEKLQKQGANIHLIEATLIGGSPLFAGNSESIETTLDFTRAYLSEKAIPIEMEFLGSAHPKKVYLNLRETYPHVRVLTEVSSTVANREKHYSVALRAGWLLGQRKTSMQFS